jgi:hypothetical protein
VTDMALAHCILGKFLGVVCHCFPPALDVPTFAARCLYVRNDARDPSSERWNCGRENCPVILPKFRLPRKFRDLLHAANLRHGTDGFTSPPKDDNGIKKSTTEISNSDTRGGRLQRCVEQSALCPTQPLCAGFGKGWATRRARRTAVLQTLQPRESHKDFVHLFTLRNVSDAVPFDGHLYLALVRAVFVNVLILVVAIKTN